MTLMLSPTAAPLPPSSAPAKAAARGDEAAPNSPGSFGEVLSRSLEPADIPPEAPTGKAAKPLAARRQADDALTPDADQQVNALALAWVPLESRLASAPAGGGAEARPDTAAIGAQAALAAAGQRGLGRAALPAGQAPGTATEAESTVMKLDTGNTAGPARPEAWRNARPMDADLPLAAPPNPAKTAASLTPAATSPSAASDAAPATALPLAGSQAPDAAALSASAALPGFQAAAAPGAASLAASPPSPMPTPTLSPEVGSSEWGKALGQQVIHMGTAGQQVAELQLNPPGLGPLKVTLSLSDQQIQAVFVSAHPSVRAAIEAALPQLRSSLADSGISLGNTSVSSESQQQPAFAQGQNGHPGTRSYRNNSALDTQAVTARPLTEPLQRRAGISVDTYA